MDRNELMETILDAFAELASLHASAAATAEKAWTALAEQDDTDLQGLACAQCRHRHVASGRPVVDAATFDVEWKGRSCYLGPSIPFKLMQRLSRRPGHYLSYDVLMTDVWDRRCSSATVRSAVKRLRCALRAADMEELAAAVRGRGGCYGLFLGEDDL